jgi:hypothetical protein
MPFVTSKDGTKIAFEEFGQGPAAILVMVPWDIGASWE